MRRRIENNILRIAFCGALLGMTGCASASDIWASLFGPSDAPALVAQGSDAMKDGNAARAEKLYGEALAMNTLSPADTAKAYLDRGLAREALAKHDDALADFTAAASANVLPPEDAARALYDRGVALDALGRVPEAIDAFTQALKLQTGLAAAYTNRGNARLRLGNLAAAKSDYEAALAAGTQSPAYVWYGLGQVAEAQGNLDDARDCYRKALGVDPSYSLAIGKLAGLEKTSLPHPLAPSAAAKPRRTLLADASFARKNDLDLRPTIDGNPQPAQSSAAQIQLGAFRDKAVAGRTWNRLMMSAGGLLDGLTPNIVPVDLPNRGRFYRLRAGVGGSDAAASLCGKLKAKGFDCFAIRG